MGDKHIGCGMICDANMLLSIFEKLTFDYLL